MRRVIGVFVKRGEVREWSREQGDWITLSLDGLLEDPTLVRPVVVRAKGNPRLNRISLARAIETACKLLRIPFGPTERTRLDSLDVHELEALLDHLETEHRWPTD